MQNAECEMMVSLRDESNTRRNAGNYFITWRECSFIASFYFIPGGDTFILHFTFSILHSKINDHLRKSFAATE